MNTFALNIPEARVLVRLCDDVEVLKHIADRIKGDLRSTIRKAAAARIRNLTGEVRVGKPRRREEGVSHPRPGGLPMTDQEYAPVLEYMALHHITSAEAMRQLIARGVIAWSKEEQRRQKKLPQVLPQKCPKE